MEWETELSEQDDTQGVESTYQPEYGTAGGYLFASYPDSHFVETDDRFMDEQAELTAETNERARRELKEFERIQWLIYEEDQELENSEDQEQENIENQEHIQMEEDIENNNYNNQQLDDADNGYSEDDDSSKINEHLRPTPSWTFHRSDYER